MSAPNLEASSNFSCIRTMEVVEGLGGFQTSVEVRCEDEGCLWARRKVREYVPGTDEAAMVRMMEEDACGFVVSYWRHYLKRHGPRFYVKNGTVQVREA